MAATSSLDAPIPLSFPAILRNSALTDRFAHLNINSETRTTPLSYVVAKKHKRSDDNLGKRWIRRKDNARLAGNPHVVAAMRSDYLIPTPGVRTTFQSPLQPYLQHNVKLPTSAPNVARIQDVNAGRFSLSLKGMRRDIRARDTYRTRLIAHTVDEAIKAWLNQSAVFLAPDADDNELSLPGRELKANNGEDMGIKQVASTPTKLVWNLGDDAFARYMVHCCARWYEVVSFSKEVVGYRLMHLLRPNVSKPNPTAAISLDTPPFTDLDNQTSAVESDFSSFDSDLVSHLDSDIGDVDSEPEPSGATHNLGAISESGDSIISRPRSTAARIDDGDADESSSEVDIMASSLELTSFDEIDPEETLRAVPDLSLLERPVRSAVPLRARGWQRSTSTSSPSPVRRISAKTPRLKNHSQPLKTTGKGKCSFYDYLFA